MCVSVIIPVYCRQEEANRAARSVLSQESVDIELIMVDDASPEPFYLEHDVANDTRVILVRREWNGGAAAARNDGAAKARHPWIAFLDSDDIWLPGKMATQLAFAETALSQGASPLTAFVTGFRQIESSSGHFKDRNPVESARIEDFASACWFAPGSTALLQRAAFDAVGPYDERLKRLEDLDWFLRLCIAGGGVRTTDGIWVEINVARSFAQAYLDDAIKLLRSKWLAKGAANLSVQAMKALSSYLWLERASIQWHSKRYLRFLWALSRSLILRPRLHAQLRQWWR